MGENFEVESYLVMLDSSCDEVPPLLASAFSADSSPMGKPTMSSSSSKPSRFASAQLPTSSDLIFFERSIAVAPPPPPRDEIQRSPLSQLVKARVKHPIMTTLPQLEHDQGLEAGADGFDFDPRTSFQMPQPQPELPTASHVHDSVLSAPVTTKTGSHLSFQPTSLS